MKSAIMLLIGLCFSFNPTLDENEMASQYIEKYRELAIDEMHRTGIPASIKMAQAMLESGMGQSSLANHANNHFGIKCGNRWEGGTYYRADDDYRNGKLIKSCFRKYQSPSTSFIAHSDFLSTQPRYGNLFELDILDYRAWAQGLRKAGYATDPNYPNKLIGIIEKYNLHFLDLEILTEENDVVSAPSKKKQSSSANKKEIKRSYTTKSARTKSRSGEALYSVSEINKIKVIVSTGNENLRQIAKDQKVSLKELKKYNKHIDQRSTSSNLEVGQVVFLDKKRKSYAGREKFHIYRDVDTMVDLSDRYGVDIEFLYLKNRMPLGAEPLVGEKIHLKGVVRLDDIPQYEEKGKQRRKKDVIF